MTSGDIQVIFLTIFAVLATLWCAILTVGVLFQEKSRRAELQLETTPVRCIIMGLLPSLIGIPTGFTLLNKGPLGLLGWVLLSCVLFLSALGASGLARLAGRRIRTMAMHDADGQRVRSKRSEFTGLASGAGILIGAGALPGLGWFLLFPLQLFASLGAGVLVLRREAGAVAYEPQAQAQRQ